jgi:hypothetical protein
VEDLFLLHTVVLKRLIKSVSFQPLSNPFTVDIDFLNLDKVTFKFRPSKSLRLKVD